MTTQANRQIKDLVVLGKIARAQGTADQAAQAVETVAAKLPPYNVFSSDGLIPAEAARGDQWFNTSDGTLWFYDGDDWVSVQQFSVSLAGTPTTQFLSPTLAPGNIQLATRIMLTPRKTLKYLEVTYSIYFFAGTIDSSNFRTIVADVDGVQSNETFSITERPSNDQVLLTFTFPKLSFTKQYIEIIKLVVSEQGSPAAGGILSATYNYRVCAE